MNQQEYKKVIDNVANGAVSAYERHGLGYLTNEEYYAAIRKIVQDAVDVLCPSDTQKEGRYIPQFDRQAKVPLHNCMHSAYCEICGLKV